MIHDIVNAPDQRLSMDGLDLIVSDGELSTTFHLTEQQARKLRVGMGIALRAMAAEQEAPQCRCVGCVFMNGETKSDPSKGTTMKQPTVPLVGGIVLYRMPANWHPELGIRIYPAIVLYPNRQYGPDGLDVQVFCQPYEGPTGYHASARRGEGPGEWQPKRADVDQQPLS